MTIVEDLKALYEALGGEATDLDGLNTKAAVLAQIAELAETIDGGGSDGASAYEIAVANGFTGTEAEWLASLKGEDGADAEPFIVTMTPDENNPLLVVGDKTFGEIGTAMSAGLHCTIAMDLTSVAGVAFSLPVLGFSDGSGGNCVVYVADVNANGLEMITGAANAYPTKTLGN